MPKFVENNPSGHNNFSISQYLLATIDIKASDFNYHLWKVSEIKYLDMSTNHVKIMNKPTRISGILIDYVSIEKTLMEKFSLIITVEHIYFSDHDVLRIVIEKKTVDFQIRSSAVKFAIQMSDYKFPWI